MGCCASNDREKPRENSSNKTVSWYNLQWNTQQLQASSFIID